MSSSNLSKNILETEDIIHDSKSDLFTERLKYSTKSCAILNCPNPIDISYHLFPSNHHLRQTWIDLCELKKSFKPKTSKICGKHFTHDNFTYSSLREKLTSQKSLKRRLKPDAAPSINFLKKSIKSDTLEFVQESMPYSNTKLPIVEESINIKEMESYPNLEFLEEPETIIELIDEPMEKKNIESIIEKSICLSRTTSQKKNCENYEYRMEILRYKVKLRNLQRILMQEKRGEKN
ncbi:unnamed protein product [Lepeophtheirus salmonis]|uniref:(salmon louse) hypothetical protein n=1 Tax=Lepeophtheirus salmonis TaxID=72036 RepID=A0A7R8CVY7_LEPSM|nr:unnamed protein product [Lepeophtheirus salmonis]CAF2948850.1 unnamed protein product [Lepeophtheirus salmonis]